MILDLSKEYEKQKAFAYLNKLVRQGAPVEIKKIQKRSNKQNRYVHALFAIWGGEYGYTVEEAKTVIKRKLGYVYEKEGYMFLERTSEMDSKRLSEFTDQFRNFSSANGTYLPSPEEFDENYVELMKQIEYIEATQKRYSY